MGVPALVHDRGGQDSMPEGLGAGRWWWMLRRCRGDDRVFLYYPSDQDGGYQVLKVCSRAGHDHAILIWQLCHRCRRGLIAKISMIPEWQGQGLGRRLINRAFRDGPQYLWTTSSQSPASLFHRSGQAC